MEKNYKWKKSQFSTDSFAKRTERSKTLTPTVGRVEAAKVKTGTFRSPNFQAFPRVNDDDGNL